MNLGFIQEMVRNVIHADHLMFIFDQHLQVIAAKNERAQQNRFMQPVAHHSPAERTRLDEAVDFIFDGCVEYLAQMESRRLYRIFQDSVDIGDLQNLESEMRNTDLSLGAVIGVLNNTPRFVPPTEGLDPKSVVREVAKDRVIKLVKMVPTCDFKSAVLIYGIGGIGKTTLASEVLKTLDLKAYKYCRLDMDENCSNNDIKHLQQQILRDLFGQGNVLLKSYEHGQDQLRETFRKHSTDRIFMFINSGLAVSTDSSCLSSGMRILLTTRKLDQTDLYRFSSGMRILVTTRKLDQTELIDLSCLPSGMRIFLTTRKLDQTDLSCLPNGMRILLTIRKLDQTDMLSRTDFEGVPYEVGSVKASLFQDIESIVIEDIVNMYDVIPLLAELVGYKFREYLLRASDLKSLKEFLKESGAAGVAIERVAYKSLDVALVKLSFDTDAGNFCSILWGTEKEMPQFILENRNVKVHDIIKERWLSQPDRILELATLKDALEDRQKLQKIKGFQPQ